MAYTALTADQAAQIRKELSAIVDPTIQGALIRIFDVLAADDDTEVAALEASVTELNTSVSNLNSWATALATKLNADAVEQNAKAAFPLTLDTDYDTTPQA